MHYPIVPNFNHLFLPHTSPAPDRQRLVLIGVIAMGVALLVLAMATSPWNLVAIAIGLVAVYLSWREPMWVVLFLAAWWPVEPFVLKFISDDVYIYARYASELLVYVLVAVVVAGVISGRYRRRATPVDLPAALFLFIVLVSAILNAQPLTDSLLGIRQIVRFMLLFFVVAYCYPRRFWVRRIAVVVLATLLVQSLLGIAQNVTGGALDELLLPSERRTYGDIQLTEGTVQFWDPGQRVFGTFGRYDRLGAFLALALLLVVAAVYENDRAPSWRWLGLLAFVGVPALILTYGRSAWLGFILGGLAIAWVRRDRRVLVGAVALFIAVALWIAATGIQRTLADVPRQSIVERFAEAFSYQRFRGEYFGLGRVFWIVHTPTVVVMHSPAVFLFGWGPASFGGGAVAALHNTRVYDIVGLPFGVYGTEGYVDNNWMSLWGETGTLGLAFFVWLYAVLMGVAWRLARHGVTPLGRALGAGYVGVSVSVAVNAFLATYFEIRTLAPYLWLLGGFVVVVANREKIITLR